MAGSETVTTSRAAWAARLPWLVLGGLVLVSTVVRFAVAQSFTTPWIAPDEMVYGMIGESLWSNGTLGLRELSSPYYSVLTPALIGAPLAWLELSEGIQWARLLQSLAMALVAVPVFLWARRIASTGWSLAAATIVLLAPAFHYTGFLMTEPLTLTVVTVSLLAMARALEAPSTWRYGVLAGWATAAAAVRLQALVLLPAFLLAAGLDAAAARDRARLRPLVLPGTIAVGVTLAVVVVAALAGGELSSRRLLGAYTPIGEGAPVESGTDAIAWHAFDVVVLGLGISALAFVALSAVVFSRRDRDPALRAFVCVAIGYGGLLVLQVGLFSAAYVGHVAERYLITVVPLLAIALCSWVSRGAPRPRVPLLAVWALTVLGAATIPIDEIAAADTLVNAPTSAALAGLGSDDRARLALVGGAVLAGACVALLPRRRAWIAAAAVGLGLGLLSLDSARRIDRASALEQRAAVGSSDARWLDAAAVGDATLLVTGDRLWTATARTIFWNRDIVEVARLEGVTVPFPPVTLSYAVDDDGTLRRATGELRRRHVVAPSTVTLAGEKVAERPAGDSQTPGLAAWTIEGPVAIRWRTAGFLPNGDFSGIVSVTVFACTPGTLDITILGKTGDPVEARVDGITVATLETPNEEATTHRIPAPPYADGTRACGFELETAGYAGTTTIVFTPA